ncbi:LOW QUALITY PROTEIN: alanyl-tRNA editing protein Aarsd1-like [Anableps anableps]
MAFQCQRDCYMKEFVTSVVSCCPAELKQEVNGRKETLKGFNVVLQDTVLFPEGGGQPDDHGLIGEVPVLRVTRQGPDAVHFVTSPLEVGQEVRVKVDWERRFDHMQQHSGTRKLVKMGKMVEAKKEGDNEFMNIIANEINTEETLVFLTVGEEKGPGLFLLAGPRGQVTELGPRILALLQGKGAGKNGRFQGKANSLARREEVEELLRQHCKHHSSEK